MMKIHNFLGAFHKPLLFLLILLIVGCASTSKKTISQSQKQTDNTKISNNLSIYYYTMAETALQESNFALALQLYIKADEAAPENILIKETILEILEMSTQTDPEALDKIITLGEEYLQKNLISQQILEILTNAYMSMDDQVKFVQTLELQLQKFPSMRGYLLLYYHQYYENKIKNKQLLEKALEQEWKDINQFITIVSEFSDDKQKSSKLISEAYTKWTREKVTSKELVTQYQNSGFDKILTDFIEAGLQSGHTFSDQIGVFYFSKLNHSHEYEKMVQAAPSFARTNSSMIKNYIFTASLKLGNWKQAAQFGAILLQQNKDVTFKYIQLQTALAYEKIGDYQQALYTISLSEKPADVSAILTLMSPEISDECKQYFKENLSNYWSNPELISYINAILFFLETNIAEANNELQNIPIEFLNDNKLTEIIAANYLDNELIYEAEKYISNKVDREYDVSKFISEYLLQSDNPKLALKYLQEYLETTEKPEESYFMLASMAAEKLNDPTTVIKVMQKALNLYPESATTLNAFGYQIADMDISEYYIPAEKYLQKALQMEPDNAMIWDSLAWLYYRQGKYKQAAKIMEEHCTDIMQDSAITYHAAEIYLKLGKMKLAKKNIIQTMVLDNNEESVKQAEELWKQYFEKEKK